MKTVLDAVIEFKGEYPYSNLSPYIVYGGEWQRYSAFWSDDGLNDDWLNVCSHDEFNALVDELASNFGECDISYQKHCSNEVIRLEGDEMKTVTHEGKVIQIGAVYEFSDDSEEWYKCGLVGFGCGLHPWKAEWESYKYIRECQAPVGTITAAPVDLVDGECYQFTAPSGIVRKGYFIPVKRLFICADGNIDVDRCTNIKLLTVA